MQNPNITAVLHLLEVQETKTIFQFEKEQRKVQNG